MSWERHVLPHGPLVQLAPKLWQVTGSLRNQGLPRNMVVHQLSDGGLWIHSAIALDEPTLEALEALGPPRVLVVPNGWHRLDCAVYKERYPDVKVLCPQAARKAVEKKVPVDGDVETYEGEAGVRCLEPAGARGMERVYGLDVGGGQALVFCDLMFNLDHMPGFGGWIARNVTASTGFFGVTRLGRLMGVSDKGALRAWLEEMADLDDLLAITVAHGAAIVEDCASELRQAAARLG